MNTDAIYSINGKSESHGAQHDEPKPKRPYNRRPRAVSEAAVTKEKMSEESIRQINNEWDKDAPIFATKDNYEWIEHSKKTSESREHVKEEETLLSIVPNASLST